MVPWTQPSVCGDYSVGFRHWNRGAGHVLKRDSKRQKEKKMEDPAGYHWSIEANGADWVWTIRNGDGGVVLAGSALSRPHAAACVVRALVLGMTATEPPALAA